VVCKLENKIEFKVGCKNLKDFLKTQTPYATNLFIAKLLE